MQRHTTLTLAALTLSIAAIATANANATTLPSLLQLAGVTSGTLTAQGATAKINFTGVLALSSTGYRFVLTSSREMTSLGPATLEFTNIQFLVKTCKSPGDTTGNVLAPGEWHTVLAPTGGGTALFLILFLLTPALTVECEGINSTFTGDLLFNAEPVGKEVTTVSANTGKCTGNTPAFTNYLNDAGTTITASLKTESGGLKSAGCEEVEGTQSYQASGMGVEIMEP